MSAILDALMIATSADAAGEGVTNLDLRATANEECTCNGLEAQACKVCKRRVELLEDDELPFGEVK